MSNEAHNPDPSDKVQLGRYLGPTEPGIGSTMSFYILQSNGEVVRRVSVCRLRPEEHERMSDDKKIFMTSVHQRLGDPVTDDDLCTISAVTPTYDPYDEDEDPGMPDADDFADEMTTDDISDVPTYDGYITSQVLLPCGDEFVLGTVQKRATSEDGHLKGTANSNPILDTRVYDVVFGDGEVREYAANVIAENLYSQIDEHGQQQVILEDIIDHRTNPTAVCEDNALFHYKGRQHRQKTTKGWELCVQWRDGSTSWERLGNLKETYPVQVAQYAVSAKLASKPAFAWWVPFVMKKIERIIAATKRKYSKTTHKFGIQLPKTVAEALQIDKETGTTFWYDALQKEMQNNRVAFDIREKDTLIPNGYQHMKCHMVFDIKMGTLHRKCCLVAGGHMTETPTHMRYSSVVSRESVRIALTIAALNNLEVMTGDILNAYLTAPCAEKIWTICGPEFGPEDEGKRAFIVRALYGLAASGQSFRNHLAACMKHLGYKSCLADPDVWMRPNEHPNGDKIYEYILLYVDDVLAIGITQYPVLISISK